MRRIARNPEVCIAHNPMLFPLFRTEGREKMARKKRKRRKHSNKGRRKMYNRRKRGGRRKMYNRKRKGGKRRANAAIRRRGAHTKAMWKKHGPRYKAILKKYGKKRGFGKVGKLISASFKG